MCYKDEVQKRNAAKLQKKFDEENVPEFIQKYLFNKESILTSINHWSVIRRLLLWLIEKKIIEKEKISDIVPSDMEYIESADINRFLKEREQNGISPTTLYAQKNIFSGFWKSMVNSPRVPVNTNVIADVSYKGIESVNNIYAKMPKQEDLDAMEEKIKSRLNDFLRERNLIIFNILKGTGLRKCELAELELSNLFLDGSLECDIPHIKVMGKGVYYIQKARTVLLDGTTKSFFEDWLIIRGGMENIIDEKAVFLNKNGKRLIEDNITDIFKTYSKGKLTPHMLRHWYGTVAAQKYGITFAQQQLGHKSVNITINSYTDGSYGLKDKLANA